MQKLKRKSRPTIIIVLGMHRSGTSALAGAFKHLGMNAGEDLLPAVEDDNPRGYFEDRRIVAIHDRLLHALGMDWGSHGFLPQTWRSDPVVLKAKHELAELVAGLTSQDAPAVIKDPRICRLLPMWRELLAEEGIEPRYALIARHPAEVAASLARRGEASAYRSGLLWSAYQLDAEFGTRGEIRAFLTYDALLEDWRRELRRCYRALGLGDFPESGQSTELIDGFLSRELRHHHLPDDSALDPLALSVFAGFEELATEGADAAKIQSAFDDWRASFNAQRRQENAFQDLLDRSLADRLGELAQHVDQLTRNQAGVSEALGSQSSSWQERLTELSVRQDRAQQEFVGQLGALAQHVDQLTRNQAGVSEALGSQSSSWQERLTELSVRQDRAQQEFVGQLGALAQHVDQLTRNQAGVSEALGSQSSSWQERLTELSVRQDRAQQEFVGQLGALAQHVDQLTRNQAGMSEALGSQSVAMLQQVQALGSHLDSLSRQQAEMKASESDGLARLSVLLGSVENRQSQLEDSLRRAQQLLEHVVNRGWGVRLKRLLKWAKRIGTT